MATVTLNPSADTLLNANQTTTNYGSSTSFYVGEDNAGSGVWRSLIKFDLSSYADATVNSATLRLHVKSDRSSNARAIRCYKVKRDWVESEATWNIYSTGNSWGTAGCADTTNDREASDMGAVTLANNESGWIEITLTASEVEEWLDGTDSNYGMLLKNDTENNDAYQYESSEDATYPPELVLNYTPAGTALTVADATHSHSADNLDLVVGLAVDDTLHSHAAESLGLVLDLVAQETSHAHSVESTALTVDLAINDTSHEHTADNIIISLISRLTALPRMKHFDASERDTELTALPRMKHFDASERDTDLDAGRRIKGLTAKKQERRSEYN
jgi:hypothetical protein